MRAGLSVLIVIVIALPEKARSQPNPDMDTALTIAIHPAVSTILQLPDEIVDMWIEDTGEIRIARVGNEIGVRPRAGTPAGVEALLVVETRTMQRTFRLRVVARARDAHRDVLVLPADERDAAPSIPDDSSVTPVEPAPPAEPEPAASASTHESGSGLVPERVEPAAEREVAVDMERDTASDAGRDTVASSSPRFELAAHMAAGLGFTGLDIAGEPRTAVQPHQTLSLRLTAAPPGAPWALEANVRGERLAGPLRFQDRLSEFKVTGPRFGAEVGVRLGLGMTWHASLNAGIGVQAQVRRKVELLGDSAETLERAALLALGIGLRYRARATLLGVDFQVRQGWPDDYFSMGVVLTVGRVLHSGE